MKCSLHVLISSHKVFEILLVLFLKQEDSSSLNWVLFVFPLIRCFREGVREEEKSLGEGTDNSLIGTVVSS